MVLSWRQGAAEYYSDDSHNMLELEQRQPLRSLSWLCEDMCVVRGATAPSYSQMKGERVDAVQLAVREARKLGQGCGMGQNWPS